MHKKSLIERKNIYCANCSHCIAFKKPIAKGKYYVMRVKCEMGIWRKRSNEEKVYKYFTILKRKMKSCPYYDPMGEEEGFIKELKKSLPVHDEIFVCETT